MTTSTSASIDRRFARRADRLIDEAKGSIAPLSQLQSAALYGACADLDAIESQMLSEIDLLRRILAKTERQLMEGLATPTDSALGQNGRDLDRHCALRAAGVQAVVRLCAALAIDSASIFTEVVR